MNRLARSLIWTLWLTLSSVAVLGDDAPRLVIDPGGHQAKIQDVMFTRARPSPGRGRGRQGGAGVGGVDGGDGTDDPGGDRRGGSGQDLRGGPVAGRPDSGRGWVVGR